MITERLIVSHSPHLRSGRTNRGMFLTTMFALAPAVFWGFYQFGLRAVVLVEIGIGVAMATERLIDYWSNRPTGVKDGHAALVGLTLALLVPVGVPWWAVAVGAVASVAIGKSLFGPTGGSPINPALVGLLIIAASWPAELNRYRHPTTVDAAFQVPQVAPPESPLDATKIDPSDIDEYRVADLFFGKQPGAIGTVSPILLLLGGLFLVWRRVTRWQAPLGFLVGLASTAAIMHHLDPETTASTAFHLSTGAAMYGAFFLCTDWSSTPVTPIGMILFGLMAGALTMLLRSAGVPYAPVAWAVVIISLTTPLLDRIALRPLGKASDHA